MSSWATYKALGRFALAEFADIVVGVTILSLPTGDPLKLRLDVADGSILDIFLAVSGRYSDHWERRLTASGAIYRHDNAPHFRWRNIPSFPSTFTTALRTAPPRAGSAMTRRRHSASF